MNAYPLSRAGLHVLAAAALVACGGTETVAAPDVCSDLDQDGYGSPGSALCPMPQADCDDGDDAVNPAAEEICAGGLDEDCDGLTDAADPDCGPPLFSFAVIADSHIVAGEQEHRDRLAAAVGWLNANAAAERLELAIVVGDIGWGEGGVEAAKEILDALDVPYVPLIGDNEIHGGSEEQFELAFAPHFAALASKLEGFEKAPAPVPNPQTGAPSYLQNVAFGVQGVRFIGLDWCTRRFEGLEGEQADLHDFPGGTLPWLAASLDASPKSTKESIVLASHHPVHWIELAAFAQDEMGVLGDLLGKYRDYVYASFGGHYHNNAYTDLSDAGYEVFVTDATWDDEVTIRLVGVREAEGTFKYRHELVVVP
ncbi:MAG: metallophosphoesterase [Deltaproteobacteria bacterium]|nr:metallophosphoesterase [Deltaproteobacteria bacterium]